MTLSDTGAILGGQQLGTHLQWCVPSRYCPQQPRAAPKGHPLLREAAGCPVEHAWRLLEATSRWPCGARLATPISGFMATSGATLFGGAGWLFGAAPNCSREQLCHKSHFSERLCVQWGEAGRQASLPPSPSPSTQGICPSRSTSGHTLLNLPMATFR